MTVKLHRAYAERRLPYRIAHIPDAVCWTLVPDTRRVLRRQRRRWHCGLRQVLRKHRATLFRPRYGALGLFTLPWAFLFELISPFVVVLATTGTSIAIATGLIGWAEVVPSVFIGWALVVAPTLAAFLMTESPAGTARGWRNLGAVLFAAASEVAYQVMTLAFRLEASFRRGRVEWGTMERSLGGSGG